MQIHYPTFAPFIYVCPVCNKPVHIPRNEEKSNLCTYCNNWIYPVKKEMKWTTKK